MDDVSTIDNRIIALLQEARDEAYARGWQDAIRSIVSAATDSAPAVGGGWVLRSEGTFGRQQSHSRKKRPKTVTLKRERRGVSRIAQLMPR